MNYSEMSDFEINCLVAEQIHPDLEILKSTGECVIHHSFGYNQLFDPCDSWADAGPIIQQSLIGIKPVSMFIGGHKWFAFEGDSYKEFNLKAADYNPLRAAMIVFLMMQESK